MDRKPWVLLVVGITVLAGVPPAIVGAGGQPSPAATTGDVTTQATTVSIQEIQQPVNDSSDASAYAGETVTTTGVVTAVRNDSSGFFIQDGTGAFSGVLVYTGGSVSVSVGDKVEVTAPVTEYFGLTELDASAGEASVTVTGSAPVPAPTTVDTGAVAQEAYEGVLVEVTNAEATALPDENGEWAVDDGSGTVPVTAPAGDGTTPAFAGETFDRVVGPVTYSFGAYKIQPSAVEGGFDGTTLTVLAYTDIGSEASGDGTMGRFISLINNRRAAATGPSVVVGNGDELSPHALRGRVDPGWEPPVRALNVIDPAAEAVQNHELDYDEAQETGDFSVFEAASEASEFPWLNANVRKDGEGIPGTQNNVVVERDGLRVGIFSVADSAIDGKAGNVLTDNGYTVQDYAAVASDQASYLKSERDADVVIALTPIGNELAKDLARNTADVDVVVTGDRDGSFAPTEVGGAVVTHPPGGAQGVAEIKLRFDDGSLVGTSGSTKEVTEELTRNATWADYIDDVRAEYGLDEVIATTEVPLSTKPDEYTEETAMGNAIAEGVRQYTDADVAVTNAGGIRGFATFYPKVTKSNIRSTLSFGNDVVTLEVTGAELRDILASQIAVHQVEYGPSHAIQVSGVTMEWVPHNETEIPYEDEGFGSIQDVYIDGEPLDPNETYVLATNRYIAEGGSSFPMSQEQWIKRYNVTMAQAVISWLNETGTVTREMVAPEVQGHLRVVDRSVEVGSEAVSYEGDTVEVTATVPEAVLNVTDDFYVRNSTAGRVNATSVTFDDASNTLTVTFDRAGWERTFSAESGIDIYGAYYDSEYTETIRNRTDRQYAALNVDYHPSLVQQFDDGDGEVDRQEVLAVIEAYNSGSIQSPGLVLSTIAAYNGDGDWSEVGA